MEEAIPPFREFNDGGLGMESEAVVVGDMFCVDSDATPSGGGSDGGDGC
jgi:hypothetical protein